MPIDYDRLNSGDTDTYDPEDGPHTALLETAKLITTNAGTQRLLTEWRDARDERTWWQSWNGFEGQQFPFTRELLVGLGIPLGKTDPSGTPLIMDDLGLARELSIMVGGMFDVKTQSRQGDGRVFVNTYVNGPTRGGLQLGLSVNNDVDIPADSQGLPAVPASTPAPTPAPAGAGAQTGAQGPTGASQPVRSDVPWEDDKPPF